MSTWRRSVGISDKPVVLYQMMTSMNINQDVDVYSEGSRLWHEVQGYGGAEENVVNAS